MKGLYAESPKTYSQRSVVQTFLLSHPEAQPTFDILHDEIEGAVREATSISVSMGFIEPMGDEAEQYIQKVITEMYYDEACRLIGKI